MRASTLSVRKSDRRPRPVFGFLFNNYASVYLVIGMELTSIFVSLCIRLDSTLIRVY